MRSRYAWLVICCSVVWLALPVAVPADAPALLYDAPLRPVDAPGTVELAAYILRAELRCTEGDCRLNVEQTVQANNPGAETTLRLGLPKAESLPEFSLRDGRGQVLDPVDANAEYAAIWEFRLKRGEQTRWTLISGHPQVTGHFLHWRCETSLLAAWGALQGVRMEIKFPQMITDDALIVAEPGSFAIAEGKTMVWDYEAPLELPPLEIIALAPATWQRLWDLRQRQAHAELALLYEELAIEAQQASIPLPDPYDQIVAEWEAELAQRPENREARINLARIYRTRADRAPALRLNYLVLAAQELELVLKQGPSDGHVADELRNLYEEASSIASENNDSAGALIYLRKASAVPGTTPFAGQETLALRLALNLAEEGRVTEALEQVREILSPEAQQALHRYMPPYYAAYCTVTTGAQQRIARHDITLYPPSAQQTLARLQEVVASCQSIEGCRASLEGESGTEGDAQAPDVTLTVSLDYPSLEVLQGRAAQLADTLSFEPDLLAGQLVAPWRSVAQVYEVQEGLLHDRLIYQEDIEMSFLQPIWSEGAEYVRWRFVELRAASPKGEQEKLEQQLGLLVLAQQRHIWDSLPSSTYWVYQVVYPNVSSHQPAWVLTWGQTRSLQDGHTIYHWRNILITMGIVGAILFFLLLIIRPRGNATPQ